MVILGGFLAKKAPSRVNFLKFLPIFSILSNFLRTFLRRFSENKPLIANMTPFVYLFWRYSSVFRYVYDEVIFDFYAKIH